MRTLERITSAILSKLAKQTLRGGLFFFLGVSAIIFNSQEVKAEISLNVTPNISLTSQPTLIRSTVQIKLLNTLKSVLADNDNQSADNRENISSKEIVVIESNRSISLLVTHTLIGIVFLLLCYFVYFFKNREKKYNRLLNSETLAKRRLNERTRKQEQIIKQLTSSVELTEKDTPSFLNYACQRVARGVLSDRVAIFQVSEDNKSLSCIASYPKNLIHEDIFKSPIELKVELPHARTDHVLIKDFLNAHYDLSKISYWVYNIEFKNSLYGFMIIEKPKKTSSPLSASNLFIQTVLNVLVLHFENKQKHEIERELFKQYYFDAFTQLPNMKGLIYQLSVTMETQPVGGILLLEVANLASINNIYGLQKGDELLLQVSERLQRITNDSNFTARIGQNKFTVLSHGWDLEGVNIYLLKLFEVLSETFILDGQKISATLNGGAAFFPRNSTDPHQLIDCAVQALQIASAKKIGKMVLYDNIAVENVSKKYLLTIALHKALEQNELEVYYQPFMATDSFTLHGAEALMRWNSPQFGYMTPDDYILIAEETGMIVEFGLWVLDQACQQAKKWQQAYNENFSIAVNVSPQQLLDPNFAKKVLEIVKKHDLNPRTLELEITEMIASKEDDIIDKNVNLLIKENIGFAIDDFGSGYASFNYIKRFASKKIKVDRKFTENIEHSPRDASLVKVIVAMGHALNSKVTAEGISTIEQFTVIKEIGCDYIQGFFIAPPMPADQFEQLISKHVPRRII